MVHASLGPEVRRADLADVARIGAIVHRAFGIYLDRMERPPRPMLRDYQSIVAGGDVWVCGAPIAALVCLGSEEGALLVDILAVDPEAQGQGLGRHLLDFAEAQARDRAFVRVVLYTNAAMHENIALYAHLGYVVRDPPVDGYDRVCLSKDL